jgi:uncharacterized flavoprotein (TIGR03862 family)
MKAAPLLRAWLARLRAAGLSVHARHRWHGWSGDALLFATPRGERIARADAVVLATGGGSWPQLGSDGAWVPLLAERGISVSPLRPANCGFDVGWSEHIRTRFAGAPVKSVVASFTDDQGRQHRQTGEFVVTAAGVEGGLIYALSAPLRDGIAAAGTVILHLDLAPGRDLPRVATELSQPRGRRSLSSHCQSRIGLKGVKMALLRELRAGSGFCDPQRLGDGDQSVAATARRTAPAGRVHQHGGRRGVRAPRRAPDDPGDARRVLRRRDARLGGADGWLLVKRLLRNRPGGRAGSATLARD